MRKLPPGGKLTASETNDVTALLGAIDRSQTGTGNTSFARDGGGAIMARDWSVPVITVRITGAPSGANYPFVEVASNGAGGWTDTDPTTGLGVWGTTTNLPAVEVTGRTDVPVNAIVELIPLPGGTGLGFAWGATLQLNTQNVDGSEDDPATTDLRFDQATHIKAQRLTSPKRTRVYLDTAGLCADTGFVTCVQENLTFNVTAANLTCVTAIVTKTFATTLLGGQQVLTDVSVQLVGKYRTDTYLQGTTIGSPGYCVDTSTGCCPGGVDTFVTTTCCPVNPIPANLTVTVSGGGGSFPLTYLGSQQWGTGPITVPGCGTCGLLLTCSGSVWSILDGAVAGDCILTFTGLSVTCSPFSATATGTFSNGGTCGCTGASRTFTVTV